jgi:hypothetical protein
MSRLVTGAMTKYHKLWSDYLWVPSALVGGTLGAAVGWYVSRSEDKSAPMTALLVLNGVSFGVCLGAAAAVVAPYVIVPVGLGYVGCRAHEQYEQKQAADLSLRMEDA